MSFGELIQNVITFAGGRGTNEKQKHKYPKIPQGIAYLNSYNKNMPIVPGTILNKKWKPRSTLIEGFDGMIGPTDANIKNQNESDNLAKIEDDINRNISSYASSYKSLMDKAQSFLTGNRTYGKSVFAAQAENSDVITPNWVGCYKKGDGDGIINQDDMVDAADINNCKTRASDLGYPVFSLYNDSGKMKCGVGQDIDRAQSLGLATKQVTSYTFSKSSGANVGGLLMNGQIGTYQDDITNNLVTDLTPMPMCDMVLGARINPNNLTATYGYNCNGTATSAFTPPAPTPVQPKTCAQYSDSDYNMPDDCYAEMWKDAGCDKDVLSYNIPWWKGVTKAQARDDMHLWATLTDDAHRNACYAPKPMLNATVTSGGSAAAPQPNTCDQFGDNDIRISQTCVNELWKSTGCMTDQPPQASIDWYTEQVTSKWPMTKSAIKADMEVIASSRSTACYPIVNSGSAINTATGWAGRWLPINDGTWANSLSILNDGTIICTNGSGYVYTRPNLQTGWTQISGGGDTTISSGWNNKCIDQSNGSKSSAMQMQLWDCQDGNANQQMTYNESNQTISIPGNMCLDVYGAQTGNGTPVIQYQCHGGPNQRWVYGADKTLRPQHTTGKCLDDLGWNSANGAKIGIWDCNGQSNQTWNFNKGMKVKSVIQINDGTYLGIGFDNNLYSKTNLSDSWGGIINNSCCVLSIIQLNDGTFVCVGTDNNLWKKSTLTAVWNKITCPNSCCVISITKMLDGSIAGVGTNGLVYTKTDLSKPWVLVDGQMTMSAIAQLKDGTIIGTSTDGAFYRK